MPPNAAIVVFAYVIGTTPLTFTARAGDTDVSVAVECASPFSHGQRVRGSYYLVRPTEGAWPSSSTVVLTAHSSLPSAALEVPIGAVMDVTAPELSSLGAPRLRALSYMQSETDVLVIEHGPFTDAASPIVLVLLELGHRVVTGAVDEGQRGTLSMPPYEDTRVGAITLTDVAGNSRRIVEPAAPPGHIPDSFTCIAGQLEATNDAGTFLATTDGGTTEGFSRGHFLSNQSAEGDFVVRVKASRLTDDHSKSIEIAFRGGFFGVSGTSLWFLYEHDGNWTGWKATPSPVSTELVQLRVVQRGRRVSGYVDNMLAGSFDLEKEPPPGPVGVFFKGPPGTVSRMRFRDFTVEPLGVPAPW